MLICSSGKETQASFRVQPVHGVSKFKFSRTHKRLRYVELRRRMNNVYFEIKGGDTTNQSG